MTESIISQAVSVLRTVNTNERRKAVEEERDYLATRRSALSMDVTTAKAALADFEKLEAEIRQAVAAKRVEVDSLTEAYASVTRMHAELDAHAVRLATS